MPCPSLELESKDHPYLVSLGYLSMTSTRQIYIIKSDNPDIGYVVVIEIGMIEVSSVYNIVEEGQHVDQGDELGHFRFGGSSYAMIFDKRANLEFDPKIHEFQPESIKTGLPMNIKAWANTKLCWLKK